MNTGVSVVSSERLSKITLAKRMKIAVGNDTQAIVGSKLVLGQSTISKYFSSKEGNATLPSLETIYNLARTYNVSVDWLLGLSDKMRIDNQNNNSNDYVDTFFALENYFFNGHLTFDNKEYNHYIKDPIFHHSIKTAIAMNSISVPVYNLWKENSLSKYRGKELLSLPKENCMSISEKLDNFSSDEDLLKLHSRLSETIHNNNSKNKE